MKFTAPLSLVFSKSALLAIALLGLQGCEYVRDVVVPANDSNPPLVTATVWDPVTQEHTWASEVTITTSDPDETFIALGAAFDSGGVRKLGIYRHATKVYDNGNGLHQIQQLSYGPIEKMQVGGVGDTVDSGLWGGFVVRPGEGATSPNGNQLLSAKYVYVVVAEDFAGNKSEREGGTFIYVP